MVSSLANTISIRSTLRALLACSWALIALTTCAQAQTSGTAPNMTPNYGATGQQTAPQPSVPQPQGVEGTWQSSNGSVHQFSPLGQGRARASAPIASPPLTHQPTPSQQAGARTTRLIPNSSATGWQVAPEHPTQQQLAVPHAQLQPGVAQQRNAPATNGFGLAQPTNYGAVRQPSQQPRIQKIRTPQQSIGAATGTPNNRYVSQPQSAYQDIPYRGMAPAGSNGPNTIRAYQVAAQSLLDEADDDDLLGGLAGDDDQGGLDSMGPATGGLRNQLPGAGHGADTPSRGGVPEGEDPHADVFANDCYPSAMKCAKCHQRIYDEWRVSAHAYATVSPMFQKFEQTITELSQGTVGTFCFRCHSPVAVQMNFPRFAAISDAPQVFREGITCVACHRVKEAYGRVHGERRIEPGPLQNPVYGAIGGDGVAQAIADKDNLKIKLDPRDKGPGQQIHVQGIKFEQLDKSGFCQPCHQVAVHPGIALEVVWAQYRASPACKKGISCQNCHMGLVPGKPQGYSYGPAAEMSGKTVNNNRKHSNHIFFGPGNSIAHPGIFPHNEKALRWNMDQWLMFDWRAGWGTREFEKSVARGDQRPFFPPPWDSADERMDARKVLDENFKLLDLKKASSIAVMEAGSHLAGPYFKKRPELGQDLKFSFRVTNASEGHNNPSGSLGAQPQLWLNVVLTGPDGEWLWESGYLDGNGDLANQHSLQVLCGAIPPDRQLFNLQTQFLITGVKGTDREMYLPVNVDFDQLPFLRPGNIPFSVMNHPPFIRMEQKSIPPLGNKMARYQVPGQLLCKRGTYRISVRMRSRMEPIYFMRFCKATPEMERRMIEQTIDLHPYTVEFTIP